MNVDFIGKNPIEENLMGKFTERERERGLNTDDLSS